VPETGAIHGENGCRLAYTIANVQSAARKCGSSDGREGRVTREGAAGRGHVPARDFLVWAERRRGPTPSRRCADYRSRISVLRITVTSACVATGRNPAAANIAAEPW